MRTLSFTSGYAAEVVERKIKMNGRLEVIDRSDRYEKLSYHRNIIMLYVNQQTIETNYNFVVTIHVKHFINNYVSKMEIYTLRMCIKIKYFSPYIPERKSSPA